MGTICGLDLCWLSDTDLLHFCYTSPPYISFLSGINEYESDEVNVTGWVRMILVSSAYLNTEQSDPNSRSLMYTLNKRGDRIVP